MDEFKFDARSPRPELKLSPRYSNTLKTIPQTDIFHQRTSFYSTFFFLWTANKRLRSFLILNQVIHGSLLAGYHDPKSQHKATLIAQYLFRSRIPDIFMLGRPTKKKPKIIIGPSRLNNGLGSMRYLLSSQRRRKNVLLEGKHLVRQSWLRKR